MKEVGIGSASERRVETGGSNSPDNRSSGFKLSEEGKVGTLCVKPMTEEQF